MSRLKLLNGVLFCRFPLILTCDDFDGAVSATKNEKGPKASTKRKNSHREW